MLNTRMLMSIAAASALAGCSTMAMDSEYIGTLTTDDGNVTATAYETLTAGVVCCGFRMQAVNRNSTDVCVHAHGGGGGRNTTLLKAGETKDVLFTDSTGWVSGSYGIRTWDPRTAPCVGMGPG